MMRKIFLCLYPNDSGYTILVPNLPGCVTEGKSFSDAIYMAIDTARLRVLDELEEGRKPPKASGLSRIKADEYEEGVIAFRSVRFGDPFLFFLSKTIAALTVIFP